MDSLFGIKTCEKLEGLKFEQKPFEWEEFRTSMREMLNRPPEPAPPIIVPYAQFEEWKKRGLIDDEGNFIK